MDVRQVQTGLNRLGWKIRADGDYGPVTTRAVADFQRGWNLGTRLVVDGKAGRTTQAALSTSLRRLALKQPTASAHFSFSEFRCTCGGTLPGCRVVRVHRGLLRGLEAYRTAVGRGVSIVSGYRCEARNRQVGGATSSQHVNGCAADVTTVLAWRTVMRLQRFSGIGKVGSTGKVRHVDVRHLSGANRTGGTPDRPTLWNY